MAQMALSRPFLTLVLLYTYMCVLVVVPLQTAVSFFQGELVLDVQDGVHVIIGAIMCDVQMSLSVC